MTTTESAKPVAAPVLVKKAHPEPATLAKSANPDIDETEHEVVTLDQLARDMKIAPREARMMLRLAAKQTRQYPNLGKEHIARQPWQWTPGSRALAEARKAISVQQEA